jgi:hypothetical protein
MLENQFIQFSEAIDPLEQAIVVPTKDGIGTSFYVAGGDKTISDAQIDIVTPDGRIIADSVASVNDSYTTLTNLKMLAPNDAYRLRCQLKYQDVNQLKEDTKLLVPSNQINISPFKIKLVSTTRPSYKRTTIKIVDLSVAMNGVAQSVIVVAENGDGTERYASQTTTGGTIELANLMVERPAGGFHVNIYWDGNPTGPLNISYQGIYEINNDEKTTTLYSNILRREEDNAQYAIVKYSCKEPAFGFPFDGVYVQQLMPINLYSPQYKQEDKIYTKRNGEQVVLFASITKEYEGETDYIPMDWHEKILMALSCDEVYINGERVTKSGNYEIDHDNCTYTDCGIKLLRATFKVTTNVTQRNSNY